MVDSHAAFGEPIAQARRKSFAAHQAFFDAELLFGLLGFLHQDFKEAGCAQIAIRLQFSHRLQLLLGLPRASGEHGAAYRMRAAFHQVSAGRHVIAETVVRQIAGAKASGEDGAACTPVIVRFAFWLVDRARAGEDAAHLALPCFTQQARKAAKHIATCCS